MENTLSAIFTFVMISLAFMLMKYLRALDEIIDALPATGDRHVLRTISANPNKSALLMDFRFIWTLYTGSYRKRTGVSQQLIAAMNRARKYLLWQHPLFLVAFLMPIASKLLSE